MPSTRVRPMTTFNWPDTNLSRVVVVDSPQQAAVLHNHNDYYDGYTSRHDYRGRQAFLRSYQFSTQKSFKEKLTRSVKELNEVTAGVIVDVRQEISRRRLSIRIFRLRSLFSSMLLSRCFTLWHDKQGEV